MSNRKYEFTGETWVVAGRTLRRIRAVQTFSDVRAGDLGGWIEAESNLSHDGDCWVYNEAQVYGSAQVYGDAMVYGDARVSGSARIYGNARVGGNARCTITPVVITGLLFTVTITDKHIQIGCQQYTASELRKAMPTLVKECKLKKADKDRLTFIIQEANRYHRAASKRSKK